MSSKARRSRRHARTFKVHHRASHTSSKKSKRQFAAAAVAVAIRTHQYSDLSYFSIGLRNGRCSRLRIRQGIMQSSYSLIVVKQWLLCGDRNQALCQLRNSKQTTMSSLIHLHRCQIFSPIVPLMFELRAVSIFVTTRLFEGPLDGCLRPMATRRHACTHVLNDSAGHRMRHWLYIDNCTMKHAHLYDFIAYEFVLLHWRICQNIWKSANRFALSNLCVTRFSAIYCV